MHAFLVSLPPTLPPSVDTLDIYPDLSISIDQVRQIQAFLSRKPIAGATHTVLVHDAHLLTPTAQHALLKTLEEPPPGSLIYLITPYPSQLLPTILSRVQTTTSNIPAPDGQDSIQLLKQLLSATPPKRLQLLDKQAFTRPQALEFLDHLEHHLHQQIIQNNYTLDASLYTLLTQTRTYLKSNVNVKLALGNLALNLAS